MLLRSIWGKTLRDERSGIIGYGLGLGLYGLLIVTMFPSVGQIPGIVEMMENYPPAIKAFMGEISALSTIEGFLALEVLTWLPLILAIFAIMSATDFIAGETERGTMDLLLSAPVRRWRLVLERMAGLTSSLIAIAVITALGTWAGLPFISAPLSLANLLVGTLAVVPLVVTLAAVSLLLGCLLMRRKLAGMIAAGLTVVFYLVNSLSTVLSQLEFWSKLSPFHYFDSYQAIANGPDWGNTMILIGAAIVLVVISMVVFERRDVLTA